MFCSRLRMRFALLGYKIAIWCLLKSSKEHAFTHFTDHSRETCIWDSHLPVSLRIMTSMTKTKHEKKEHRETVISKRI